MSEAANRRILMESVRTLCWSNAPTQEMVLLSITSLARVLSDLTGEEIGLQLVLHDDAAPHNQQQGE